MGPYPHDAPATDDFARESRWGRTGSSSSSSAIRTRPRSIACSGAWGSTPWRSIGPNGSRSTVRAASTWSSTPSRARSRRGFAEAHGPSAPAMAFRVVDADHAFDARCRSAPSPWRRPPAPNELAHSRHRRHRRAAHLSRGSLRREGLDLRRGLRVDRRARSRSLPGTGSGTSTTSPTTCIAAGSTSGRASTSASSTSARSATSTSRAG